MRGLCTAVVAVLVPVVLPIVVCANTIHVPIDQPSIQQGIDAADPGDTVLVAADTYTGALNRDLDFSGKNVTLRGESLIPSVVIDCEGMGRGFYFHSGEDTTATVEFFTITNAAADTGAGLMCRAGSSPRFLHCRFEGNLATARGGAACCLGAVAPIFRDCEFEDNDASGTRLTYGGAIACVNGASPMLRDCLFAGNTATNVGGAVYSGGSTPTISSCVFTSNNGAMGGGGVFSSGNTPLIITDCEFTGNWGSQGSAIYTQSSPVTATGCEFIANGYGAVTLLYETSAAVVSNCTFVSNVSHMRFFGVPSATVSNCTFVSSSSPAGSIGMVESSPTFENCVFAFSGGVPATCEAGTETPSFSKCVLFSNAGGDDLCGSVSDTLHRDPLFCDLAGGDLDLCENSVCASDNNAWSELVGALDVGCPSCGSPVEAMMWGSVKALYR